MNDLNKWTSVSFRSVETFANTLMAALPKIIGAILILLVGFIIARILKWIVGKALQLANVNRLSEKLGQSTWLESSEVKIDLARLLSKFVYWLVILVFVITASDALGLSVVSQKIGELLSYLPVLLSAVIIFLVGLYLANFIRKVLKSAFQSFGIMGAKLVSSICYYFILAIVTITALTQAGVNTDILTNNITIILGSVLFAFAISFGLGSKELLQNMLSGTYAQRSISVGDTIKYNQIEGEVVSISGISIKVKTKQGLAVIPARDLMLNQYEIINN